METISTHLLLIAQVIVLVGSVVALVHFSTMVIVGFTQRSERKPLADAPFHYAFMVPGLNEELVIAETIERLLAHPDNATIYIINDGSEDKTGEIAQSYADTNPRVRVLHRTRPYAQQGKGEALNACYRQIVDDYREAGIDPSQVILCVMDADGLLDTHALEAVSPWFMDEEIGGVQIAVRIINRWNWKALVQDVDFFLFGQITQRARNRIGSVGLGGNGQFTRLSAMMELGDAPWTDCLTEDLDLGLELIRNGWRNAFTATAAVHQQGLVDIRKLTRQRTRWIQGQFQCWRRIPGLVAMRKPLYTKADLIFHLLWPVMSCLLFPIAVLTTWPVSVYKLLAGDPDATTMVAVLWLAYLMAFGPNVLVGIFYRRKTEITWGRALMMAHVMALFQLMLCVAGWRAMGRLVSGKKTWAKTERLVLTDPEVDGGMPVPMNPHVDLPTAA